jgi:hypothetical protein
MNGTDFKKLISIANLELAWRRITTASNYSYKRFSRDIFHIYEIAVDQNLTDLHARLEGNSYRPCAPKRIFVPKKNGLQRGISLLHVEDQIVYQAVANIVAEKVREKRADYLGKTVFSNQVASPPESIFFLQNWRRGYREYLDQIERLHSLGYRWVAQFDLAAFYDTISHELLFQTVSRSLPRSSHWNVIRSWFQKWAEPTRNMATAPWNSPRATYIRFFCRGLLNAHRQGYGQEPRVPSLRRRHTPIRKDRVAGAKSGASA